MNKPNRISITTLLLNTALTALPEVAPFLKPEYAETAAALIAWLLLHWPT